MQDVHAPMRELNLLDTAYAAAVSGEGSSMNQGTQQVWNGRGECVYIVVYLHLL